MSKGHEFERKCREWVEKRSHSWKLDPLEAMSLEKVHKRGGELEATEIAVLLSLMRESLELTTCAESVNASPGSVKNWAEIALQRSTLRGDLTPRLGSEGHRH